MANSRASSLLSGSTSNVLSSSSSSSAGDDFYFLLGILSASKISSLIVGEECQSWTWSCMMCVLRSFSHLTQLSVNVGFEKRDMPSIATQQQWLDFLGENHASVARLQRLRCIDDSFLRCITSLSSYRA